MTTTQPSGPVPATIRVRSLGDRRRSRSETSADDSDDDGDAFYECEEYEGGTTQGSTGTNTPQVRDSPVAEQPGKGSKFLTPTTTTTDTQPVASALPSPQSTLAAGATTGTNFSTLEVDAKHHQNAVAASRSSPQPTVAPIVIANGGPSIDTAAGGSPSPARPPRPASYSTPQSASRPIAGSVGAQPSPGLVTARTIQTQVGQQQQPQQHLHTNGVAGTTISQTTTTIQPSTSSGTHVSSTITTTSQLQQDPPPSITIKNLDTSASSELENAPQSAMTINSFEQAQRRKDEQQRNGSTAHAQAASTPNAASSSSSSVAPLATTPHHVSHSSISLTSAQQSSSSSLPTQTPPPPPEKAEEVHAKKATLGFMSRLKQALHLQDKSDAVAESNVIKVKTKHRSYQDLTDVKVVQTIQYHSGPIWTVAISAQGDFIATGGQDSIVRVWATMGSTAAKELEERLKGMKAQQEQAAAAGAGASTPATDPSGVTPDTSTTATPNASMNGNATANGIHTPIEIPNFEQDFPKDSGTRPIMYPIPFRSYSGHKADVIDLAWSKANFLLSASIDKTVRLWHVTRQKCLCVFQHADFVTAVAFHPIEDRYFVSGSFDKKLRIWNIPEHRVVEWAQTSNIITAATFNPNGNMTVAGLYNGQCVFYQTDGLKYFTQVDAKNRCFEKDTLLMRDDGKYIRAGDVTTDTKLVDSRGHSQSVLSSEADTNPIMYTLNYGRKGSHTVTPDHLVTLRWNLAPSFSINTQGMCHQLVIEGYQLGTENELVRFNKTFRFLSHAGQALEETHTTNSSLLPASMSIDQAIQFGRRWLGAATAAGQVTPLWCGDLVDVRVDNLELWRSRDPQLREQTLLPMLSNEDVEADDAIPIESDSDAQSTIPHAVRDDDQIINIDAALESQVLASFCSSEGIDAPVPTAPQHPIANLTLQTLTDRYNTVLSEAKHISLASGHDIISHFASISTAQPDGKIQWQEIDFTQPLPQVDAVYQLNNLDNRATQQLTRALDLLHLRDPHILLTHLTSSSGDDDTDSLSPHYQPLCRATMQLALTSNPNSVVVFGEQARAVWLRDWRKLENVVGGYEEVTEDGVIVLHLVASLSHQQTKHILIHFSPDPSSSSTFDILLRQLSLAHGLDRSSTAVKNAISSSSSRTYSRVTSITQSLPGSYPIQKIGVSSSDHRLVLADSIITHNSGRNRKGKKVTGMQFSPDGKTMLVTTNDSRIRLYDMSAYDMIAKFKGNTNDELQIRAWFSEDGSKVICGGESHSVFVWSAAEYQGMGMNMGNGTTANGTITDGSATNSSSAAASSTVASSSSSSQPKPDVKCDSSESFRAFDDTCTSAQFLPSNTIKLSCENEAEAQKVKHLIVAAGYQGDLKFFENRGVRKAT